MLHEYHVIYSDRCYLRFHVTAVGLGTYYPWIWRHACICIWGLDLLLSIEQELVRVHDTEICKERVKLRVQLTVLEVYVILC
jgi:hypothetical protein